MKIIRKECILRSEFNISNIKRIYCKLKFIFDKLTNLSSFISNFIILFSKNIYMYKKV